MISIESRFPDFIEIRIGDQAYSCNHRGITFLIFETVQYFIKRTQIFFRCQGVIPVISMIVSAIKVKPITFQVIIFF